ncbi:hypothetical protein ACFVXQ_22310 [Kitasatospora sp. NPDC058263]
MSYRTKLRGVVVGACAVTLLASSSLLTLPAQAQDWSSRSEQQVASFFQDYLDATEGRQHDGKSPLEVREEYLTIELDEALTAWGSDHQTDPVLRAQKLPKTWSTTESDSTPTHTKIIVTENWADGTSQNVWYQVRLTDLVIDSLEDPTPVAAS